MIDKWMLHDLYPDGRILERDYQLFGCAYRVSTVDLSFDFLAFLTCSNAQ